MRRPNSGSGEMPESITATPIPRPVSSMSEVIPSVWRSEAPVVAGMRVARAETGPSIERDSTSSRLAKVSRLSVGRSTLRAEID